MNDVTVTQGSVIVCDVSRVRAGRDFAVYQADLHTKYAEVLGYSGQPEILLYPGEHGIKALKSEPPTVIRLPDRYRGWHIEAGVSRYTLTVAMWRPPTLWVKPAWQEDAARLEELIAREHAENDQKGHGNGRGTAAGAS